MVKVLRNDRYVVQREGEHEGPRTTTTAADRMKWWDVVEVSGEGEISNDEHIRGQM